MRLSRMRLVRRRRSRSSMPFERLEEQLVLGCRRLKVWRRPCWWGSSSSSRASLFRWTIRATFEPRHRPMRKENEPRKGRYHLQTPSGPIFERGGGREFYARVTPAAKTQLLLVRPTHSSLDRQEQNSRQSCPNGQGCVQRVLHMKAERAC